MDYQGNYFPDERDENESKIYRIIKGTIKTIMYSISFLVIAVILIILFINRESKILEKNYFASLDDYEITDTDELELYRINAKVFMNKYGSLQLHNIDYSDEYNVMEIGVKFNRNKLTDGEVQGALNFRLTDTDGNFHPLIYTVYDGGGRYGYARLVFSNIDIDLESNDLRYDNEHPDKTRTNQQYYLSVYSEKNDELIYDFVIYDNTVTFYKTEYND